MIQMRTKLVVADNSGAKIARCIKVLGGSNKMITKIGDKIIVSIQSVSPTSKIKKGEKAQGVIVRTIGEIKRKDGSVLKFEDNAVVLVNKDNDPIATRVFGPVAREVKNDFPKITSLASEVL